jgi:hypothetical protein
MALWWVFSTTRVSIEKVPPKDKVIQNNAQILGSNQLACACT